MKRQILVVVVVVAAVACSSAIAEDSLTIYGKLNRAATALDRDTINFTEYANRPDRLGFVAKEQLSSHWHAVAKYELGFGDAGGGAAQIGLNRTRHAYLALNHDSVGTFSLGQTWSAAYISTNFFDTTNLLVNDAYWASAGIGSGDSLRRVGNSLFYVSPRWGDLFTVAANYTADNDGDTVGNSSQFDFGITLDAGQLTVGLNTSHAIDADPTKNSTNGTTTVNQRRDLSSFAIGYNFAGETWYLNPVLIYQRYEVDNAGSALDTEIDHTGLNINFGWGNNSVDAVLSRQDITGGDVAILEYSYKITKRTKFNMGGKAVYQGKNSDYGDNYDETLAIGFAHNF